MLLKLLAIKWIERGYVKSAKRFISRIIKGELLTARVVTGEYEIEGKKFQFQIILTSDKSLWIGDKNKTNRPRGQNGDKMNFKKELTALINKASMENGSNTPDYILAEYLNDCLSAFDKAVKAREGSILVSVHHITAREGEEE